MRDPERGREGGRDIIMHVMYVLYIIHVRLVIFTALAILTPHLSDFYISSINILTLLHICSYSISLLAPFFLSSCGKPWIRDSDMNQSSHLYYMYVGHCTYYFQRS